MSKTQEPVKRQSHNLSQDQLVALQGRQSAEEHIDLIKSNGVDPDYEIQEHEKHLVHVRLETPLFDPNTGAKLSVPFVQTFYENEFAQMEKDNNLAGYKVEILHDPSKTVDESKLQLNLTPKSSSIPEIDIDTTLEKPLEEMSMEDLIKTYRKFYSEEPLPEWTGGELIDKINERIDFIEAKKQEYMESGRLVSPVTDKGVANKSTTVEDSKLGIAGQQNVGQRRSDAQRAKNTGK